MGKRSSRRSRIHKELLELEKRYLLEKLVGHHFNIVRAAKHLGIDRGSLYKRFRSMGLDSDRQRKLAWHTLNRKNHAPARTEVEKVRRALCGDKKFVENYHYDKVRMTATEVLLKGHNLQSVRKEVNRARLDFCGHSKSLKLFGREWGLLPQRSKLGRFSVTKR